MGAVTDYLFDTSFLTEMLTYLESAHAVRARIVDSGGQPIFPSEAAEPPGKTTRFIPFTFSEDVGGLQCGADSTAALDAATPHIEICLAAVRQLLQQEAELRQAAAEMLELSEELHFLFRLANKIIGISNLQEFCTVLLQEVGKAIAADSGLVKTSVLWKEKVEIKWQLPAKRRRELRQLGFLHQETQERTVIYSLTDGTSTLVAPIRGKEGTVGHLAFFRSRERRPFTAYQKKFLSIIENIYSPTIETIRLYDSLQDLYLNTVKALAAAIDAKDQHTHGHSFRVARYVVAIGHEMEVKGRDLADLEIAAYMHDLGKIGISETILSKPGKLTDAEYAEIKMHPVFTDKILQPINLPAFIVDAAVHHHERLDGSGYPHGLKGEEVSLFARIIAVADVFDALTSSRPYRKAMSVETALKIICDGIDHQFDRRVVLALVASLQDEEIESVLADQNIELDFAEIHQLNDFLRELIEFLTPKEAGCKRLGPRHISN